MKKTKLQSIPIYYHCDLCNGYHVGIHVCTNEVDTSPASTMNFKSKGIPKNDAIYIGQLEERIKALEDWRDKKIAYGVS